MPVKEFPEEINQHKNHWVVLTFDDKFITYAVTPGEALDKGRALGHNLKDMILLYVPDQWPNIHGSSLRFFSQDYP